MEPHGVSKKEMLKGIKKILPYEGQDYATPQTIGFIVPFLSFGLLKNPFDKNTNCSELSTIYLFIGGNTVPAIGVLVFGLLSNNYLDQLPRRNGINLYGVQIRFHKAS